MRSVEAREFDDGLLRLADILGSIHHLRTVCRTGEGALWRNKMMDLLDVAGGEPGYRKSLISQFNEAYYDAERAFKYCSPEAAGLSDQLIREGHNLSRRLAGEMSDPFF